MNATGDVYAGFGTSTNPSFSFSTTEPSGLSSPSFNSIAFITSALERLRTGGKDCHQNQ